MPPTSFRAPRRGGGQKCLGFGGGDRRGNRAFTSAKLGGWGVWKQNDIILTLDTDSRDLPKRKGTGVYFVVFHTPARKSLTWENNSAGGSMRVKESPIEIVESPLL